MENRLPLRISLGLILAVMVAYLPVVGCSFVDYDDGPYVFLNPHVNTGLTRENIRWAWTHVHSSNWHPLTWMSHQLDCQLFALKPRPPHLVNLIWHIANTVGLFLVLRRMTGEEWRPALVAALFGLHPLHVESVAWIAERKDVLSTFFAILTLGLYTLYAARPSVSRYLAMLMAFVLGLLCKPMLVTWPFVLLLMDYWPLRRCPLSPVVETSNQQTPRFAAASWRRLILEKLPLLAFATASSVVTILAQINARQPSQNLALSYRIGNGVVAYAAYLRKMVWPLDLAVFYQHEGSRLQLTPVIVSATALLLLSLMVFLAFRRRPALLVGWFWYLGTLVPVIGIVQVGLQSMADRYTYIPLIGIFMALAWSIPALPESRLSLRIVLGLGTTAILFCCLVLTFRQTTFWRNTDRLWRRALEVAESPYGHCLYADSCKVADRPEEAERHYEIAVRMDPQNIFVWLMQGDFLMGQGRVENALTAFEKAQEIAPTNGAINTYVGRALLCLGRTDDACREFQTAVLREPDLAHTHCDLAVTLARLGDHVGAAREYREGLRLEPKYAEEVRKAAEEAYGGTNRRDDCPPLALMYAEQACGVSITPQPEMYRTLARAYTVNHRLIPAYLAAQRALSLAQANDRADLLPQLREQIGAYREAARIYQAKSVASSLAAPADLAMPGCMLSLAPMAFVQSEYQPLPLRDR